MVGWVVTTEERKGEKYGGAVLLSGLEVQQAARFQWRYKNDYGYSRFVTLVMENSSTGEVEPKAYQVSDLAVCLERDGIFAKAADSNMVTTRVPGQGEMVPTVVFKDRPLLPSKEFLPDEFIVKVIALAPKSEADWMFQHAQFPSMKDQPTDAILNGYMKKYRSEDYLTKLSDFNLLTYLASKSILPPKTLTDVCLAISNRTPIGRDALNSLDAIFATKGWI